MQIGRRIYYDLATGNPILDTGERAGDVVETTIEQDFAAYAALTERVPETVGVLQLEYGQYAQDFAECSGYRVDVSGDEPVLIFSYPDQNDPDEPPVYQPPLSEVVATLEEENALLALELAQTQLRLDRTESEQAALLLELVSREVI
jgi:hypothetical protein